MKFLTEKQVAKAVRDLIKGTADVRIAVAFWGKGGSDLLGVAGGQSKPRVICNLDSGACNPDELLSLAKCSKLKTHPRLHAKVYWTPNGVIIGSSNASTNGLWTEGTAARGWHEANFLIREKSVIEDVGGWFEREWDEANRVTKTMIEAARPLWEDGRRGAPRGHPLQKSLTEAFLVDRTNPAWDRIMVCVYVEPLSDEGQKLYDETTEANAALAGADAYEDWEGLEAKHFVIDVNGIEKRPLVNFFWTGEEIQRAGELTFAWKKPGITLPGIGHFRISAKEKTLFASLIQQYRDQRDLDDEGGVVRTLKQAMKDLGL